jgi:hypothetical protein
MPSSAPRRAAIRLVPALAAALVLATALAGCGVLPQLGSTAPGLVGTGDLQQDVRDLGPISRVSVAGGFKVIVGIASTQQVVVEAQGNILPAVKTTVEDGQLIATIEAPDGITVQKPISITVRVTSLGSVALSNGATGYVEHTGSALNLDVSGGSQLVAIGDTPDLTLTVTSGALAKLGELAAAKATITVSDGATAELTVTGALSGTASGGSTVTLKAKPSSNTVTTSSGATVQGG